MFNTRLPTISNPVASRVAIALAALALLGACDRQNTSKPSSQGATMAAPLPLATPETSAQSHDGKPGAPKRLSISTSADSPEAMRERYGVSVIRVADAGKKDNLDRADRNFVKEAAIDGMYEVEVGKIASEQGGDPAVKSFGRKLASDHSAANDELKQLSSARNLDLPGELPMAKQRSLDKLRKASGSQFDRQFIDKVAIKDHEKDIKRFEEQARKGKDPEIRAWAEKTLPKLREHLADARRLQGNSGADRAGMAGRPGDSVERDAVDAGRGSR